MQPADTTPPRPRAVALLVALAIGVILHAVVLLWLLRTGEPILLLLAGHIVGAIAFGWGIAGVTRGRATRAWLMPVAMGLTFPLAGLFGAVGMLLVLRRPPVDRSARRYIVWNDEPHADWPDALPAGASGQSIVEILQSPRTQLRRNAILALRELDPSVAIPLLRKGLQDSDEQVRIYAQNILSSMLERFEEGVKQLEQKLAANAGEAITAMRLAEQYFELVYLEVAGDDETAAHYLGKALALLERAHEAAPHDRAIAVLGFKYALRGRNPTVARRWLGLLEDKTVDAQHVLPWRMELAFLEGDWAELRRLFGEFAQARYVNPRIEELAQFWHEKPEAAA